MSAFREHGNEGKAHKTFLFTEHFQQEDIFWGLVRVSREGSLKVAYRDKDASSAAAVK